MIRRLRYNRAVLFAAGMPTWLVQSLPYIEQRLFRHSFRCTNLRQTTYCRLHMCMDSVFRLTCERLNACVKHLYTSQAPLCPPNVFRIGLSLDSLIAIPPKGCPRSNSAAMRVERKAIGSNCNHAAWKICELSSQLVSHLREGNTISIQILNQLQP